MQLKTRSLYTSFAVIGLLAALAIPAMAAPSKKTSKSPKKVVSKTVKKVAKPAPKANPALKPVIGTWFLRDGEKEVKSTKIVFSPLGTFLFIGSGWKSEGKFSLKDNALSLEWTKVDGTSVKAGTMKKTLLLAEDLAGFKIDKFNYRKSV